MWIKYRPWDFSSRKLYRTSSFVSIIFTFTIYSKKFSFSYFVYNTIYTGWYVCARVCAHACRYVFLKTLYLTSTHNTHTHTHLHTCTHTYIYTYNVAYLVNGIYLIMRSYEMEQNMGIYFEILLHYTCMQILFVVFLMKLFCNYNCIREDAMRTWCSASRSLFPVFILYFVIYMLQISNISISRTCCNIYNW